MCLKITVRYRRRISNSFFTSMEFKILIKRTEIVLYYVIRNAKQMIDTFVLQRIFQVLMVVKILLVVLKTVDNTDILLWEI